MRMDFEQFYLGFNKIRRDINVQNNISIIDNLLCTILQNCGFLLKKDKNYLFLQLPNVVDIDLFFYYKNQDKLDKIFHQNNIVKFLIHFIFFSVHTYLTPDKLISIVKDKISQNNINLFEITNDNIIAAHNILLDSGIVKKDFCLTNTYYDDNGKFIIIKDTWVYTVDSSVNYLQKIMLMRCVNFL